MKAANPYPTTDFIKTFSKTTVEAKADNTKKVVDTGIPNLVNKTKTNGAAA